jgi:hypothetical protein
MMWRAASARPYSLVEVLIRGVLYTFGFEDCLTVEPETSIFLPEDEAVPESLTLPAVCEAGWLMCTSTSQVYNLHLRLCASV